MGSKHDLDSMLCGSYELHVQFLFLHSLTLRYLPDLYN